MFSSGSKNTDREQSSGEITFDRGVYTGIGFGVNEGLSLWLTDEFEHGMGKKYFEDLAKKAAPMFKETVANGQVVATAEKNAANMLMTLGLLMGGTLLIPPMKYLEDNKPAIVEWLNHKFDKGNLTAEQTKERDLEVAHALEKEPDQSWGSLLMGRAVAVAATLSFGKFMGASGNKKVMNLTESAVKATPAAGMLENARAKRYVRLAGVETIYCAISSVVLEGASKLMAGRGKGDDELLPVPAKPDQKDEQEIPQPHYSPEKQPNNLEDKHFVDKVTPRSNYADMVEAQKSEQSHTLAT